MNSRLKCNSVLEEYLVGSFEAETFSGSVVVALEADGKVTGGQAIEVGVAWESAAETANRVFDAPFLPRGMSIAEPGLDAEALAE